jgi:hypothetical protein
MGKFSNSDSVEQKKNFIWHKLKIPFDFIQVDISDTTLWCVHNRLFNANFDANVKKKTPFINKNKTLTPNSFNFDSHGGITNKSIIAIKNNTT